MFVVMLSVIMQTVVAPLVLGKLFMKKKLKRKEAEQMKVSPLKLMEPYHSQNMQSVSGRKVHFSSERKKKVEKVWTSLMFAQKTDIYIVRSSLSFCYLCSSTNAHKTDK